MPQEMQIPPHLPREVQIRGAIQADPGQGHWHLRGEYHPADQNARLVQGGPTDAARVQGQRVCVQHALPHAHGHHLSQPNHFAKGGDSQ